MSRFRLLLAIAVAALAGSVVTWTREAMAQDRCLDRGGAWFGPIGCETQLPTIDSIVIDKSDRQLAAYSKGLLVRKMPVSLGSEPKGAKDRAGDNRTPEGTYSITQHKADSAYHLALRLGYPTPQQREHAQSEGVDPGGDIMIHGIRNGLGWIGTLHRRLDWTRGCIALTNGEIEWLYRVTSDGVPVEIRA